ncbi:MAG: cation transporter [Desulfarculus sp.]|jgi:cation diffusion facilitator family transporter|nr:MAG: cation transporter [Desulfarculus sp.]
MAQDLEQSGRQGRRVTWLGVWVNALLVLGKLLAGVYGRSQAMLADAVHSLSDLVTDGVVLVGLKLGRRAPDPRHHFGHGRMETMSASLVGLALVGVAVWIGYQALHDIITHVEHHPTWLALVAAAVSIAAKEALYRVTVAVGRRINSPAVVANAWHHRSDALSSVAVLLGVAGSLLNPDWHSLDAWAALVVALLICKVGLEVLWGALKEMADTAPPAEVLRSIQNCALDVPGVLEMHDLKVRSAGGRHQIQLHIVVDAQLNVMKSHRIAKEVERCLLAEVPDAGEVIVHVDPCDP